MMPSDRPYVHNIEEIICSLVFWKYGHFMLTVSGELRARFPRSRLGALWFILHPLAPALIFLIIRADFVQAKMPNVNHPCAYPIYLS